MSLTAHYEANFDDFYAAVQKADVELKKWETSGEAVTNSMNRIANSLTGAKVIQDATMMANIVDKLGGTASFTDKELAKMSKTAGEAAAKMRAMGEDVPPKIQDLADEASTLPPILGDIAKTAAAMFTVDAIVGFTKEVVALASEIKATSLALGITYDEFQKLQFIAAQTGTPIDALTKGMQTLEQRLGDENSGAAGRLKQMGISLEEFGKADVYNKAILISEGMRQIGDQSKFAATGADLFGGSWRQIAPALKSDMEGIGKQASTMSTETVDGLEAMSSAATSLWNVFTVGGATVLGAFANYLKDWDFESVAAADSLKQLAAAIAKVAPAWDLMARAGDGVKLSEDELTKILNESNRELTESIAKNKEMTAAQEELASAGRTWGDTVRGLNQDTVAAVQAYLEAGVSQKSLATAYSLTTTEVRAITEALKAEHKAIEMTNRLWNEYNQTVIEQTGTSTDVAIANIERWASETARIMREAGADTAEFYEALAEVTHAKMNDVLIDWTALGDASQETYSRNLEQIAQKAEATYQYMIGHSEQFSVATLQRFGETAQAARDAANNWRESWAEAGTAATTSVQQAASAASAAIAGVFSSGGALGGGAMGQSGAQGGGTIDTAGLSIPMGVEEFFKRYTASQGGGALGGSIVRAQDPISWGLSHGLIQQQPAAPTFPAGGVAGGGLTQNINLNGLLGTNDPQTKALIKDMVGEAMMGSMMNGRLLSSA